MLILVLSIYFSSYYYYQDKLSLIYYPTLEVRGARLEEKMWTREYEGLGAVPLSIGFHGVVPQNLTKYNVTILMQILK